MSNKQVPASALPANPRRARQSQRPTNLPPATKGAFCGESSDPRVHNGIVQLDMYCHICQEKFTARVDHRINGNHVVLCPRCGHEHCRVVEDGVVTGVRFETRNHVERVEGERRWTHQSLPMETGIAADFIRDKILGIR